MNQRALIVDDDPLLREMMANILTRKLELPSRNAENGREALSILERDHENQIKIVICDLEMPVMNGFETLAAIQEHHPGIPVIILTGRKDDNNAAKAMSLGAVDFLSKPFEQERVMVTIKNALKLNTLKKEVTRLKTQQDGTFTFDHLIGHAQGLKDVVEIGRKAAASDIPALITGETGTGKEVFCRAIHGEGGRAGSPFIAVNCGAIPSQLVESTLFGHEKGSFTGATEKTIGKFREAEGGTIFLDEVGELPMETQVKLLRVLQQKEVEPVGAGKSVPVNVRVISATNRDLQQEVEDGKFREDLYFRLNVLQIKLPPLRERPQDVVNLAQHFIERFCASEGHVHKDLSKNAQKKLQGFHWPGNVRQLENLIHRAMVMSDGQMLEIDDLMLNAGQNNPISAQPENANELSIALCKNDQSFKTMNEIEIEAMRKTLDHFGDNVTKASSALGIAKSTFYRKLEQSKRQA